MRFSSHRGIIVVSTLALAALTVGVCFVRPGVAWLPPCPFFTLTGFYCPGCGSTRMLYYLVHGHPLLAFRQNPLSMLMLPVALYGLARQWLAAGSAVFSRLRPAWITAFGILVVLFAVARNIPAEPFCQLAPGGQCIASSK